MTGEVDDRPRWRLDQLYSGLDDRRFANDSEQVAAEVQRMEAWFDDNDVAATTSHETNVESAALLVSAIEMLDRALRTQRRVRAYVHALTTTDAYDVDASTAYSRLVVTSGAIARLSGRLDGFIGQLDARQLVDLDPRLTEHSHALMLSARAAEHRMSDAEESLALDLGLDGQVAWRTFRDQLSGQLNVHVDHPDLGTTSMAAVRGFATHSDPTIRDAAYVAEVAAWRENELPLAAALNAYVGAQTTLNQRRGWSNDLDPALDANGIDADVLEVMNAAVTDSLGDFRRFCHAKARLLGRGPSLRWADLVAPVGSPQAIPWNEAVDVVRRSFATFSPQLANLVDTAIDDGWIDAEIRDGKRSGAFCMPVEGAVSRVLMNYDHSADAIQTLAHELGHAFHNTQLAERTELQRRTPRALAETASILCETIVTDALLASAEPAAEMALLNTDLSGATQVVVDIRSRFLFELDLYARRRKGVVPPHDLNEMMVAAQTTAYGDGVDAATYHPYMWAVKPHYYTPFYNVPYTFGLLFGLGLAQQWKADPERFVGSYNDLLSRTAMGTAVDLAAEFGIDLRSVDFWASGLDHLATRIERFVQLAEAQSAAT